MPRLIPIASMARLAGVTVRWLRSEAEAGRVPCLWADGRILMDRETVEAILLERARSSVEGAAR